jgi:uncharacterized protein (TIGR02145 family)
MRQKDIKVFGDVQSGRLNSDDSPFALTTNEWVNAENVRTGTTDKGATGIMESVGGNVKIEPPVETVVIGTQEWTVRNLDVTTYRNGDIIPEITDPIEWSITTEGAWCYYGNNSGNGEIYGKLYNSYAVNDPRGLAPIGYHIPSETEWDTFINYLGGQTTSGGRLKETGFTYWESPNTGAINDVGFNALGGGWRADPSNNFLQLNQSAYFWQSSFFTTAYGLSFNNTSIIPYAFSPDGLYGASVRLIKDADTDKYKTIGTIEDTENERLVYFNYDTTPAVPTSARVTFDCNYIASNYPVLSQSSSITINDPDNGILIFNGVSGGYFTLADALTNLAAIVSTYGYSAIAIGNTITVFAPLAYGSSVNYLNVDLNITITSPTPAELNDTLPFTGGVSSGDANPDREDEILCLYTKTNTIYTVLKSSQVTGRLNFDKNSLIHSAHIANGILSWTDGTNNQPRKINIESGISANYPTFVTEQHTYVFPINFSEITLIKPPPIFTPNFTKIYDSSYPTNFIANESFQFAFQYQYYDNEITVIGAYSQSTKLNFTTDNFNKILVNMDFSEEVPETVKIVNLIVRFSESNDAFIVNRWDKRNSNDLIAINDHNNKATALTYNFYNDTSGEIITQADVLRPFDSVPIYSQTHEIAKQRYFLANNIDGYDTPQYSSMTLGIGSYTFPSSTTKTTNLIMIRHYGRQPGLGFFNIYGYQGYYVFLAWAIQPGYYVCNTYETTSFSTRFPTAPRPGATLDLTNLTFRGSTLQQVVQNTLPRYYNANTISESNQTIIDITNITLFKANIYPQASVYKSGIVFYDFAMRKCGVVTNGQSQLSDIRTVSYFSTSFPPANGFDFGSSVIDLTVGQVFTISGLDAGNGTYTILNISITLGNIIVIVSGSVTPFTTGTATITWNQDCTITTPLRDEISTYAIDSFIWNVNNNNALAEIPEWAYYYAPVLTKNLTKRFFISSITNCKYAIKKTDGSYVFDSTLFVQQAVAIAIDTTALNQTSLGYVFTEGDVCLLTNNSTTYTLPVIGQESNWILLKSKDIGDVTRLEFSFEIYTPYKTNEQEPFYEMGEIYNINFPGTILRSYSRLFSYFKADSYLLTRTFDVNRSYLSGAMSPNDLYYKNWYTDGGKVSVITKLGQVDNNTEILWSDTYISGTQINGSSTFRIGAQSFVSDDCGYITKLQNTSKVQDEGSVMLSLCAVETNSMYLGETQITDSTGGVKFFSSATNIIGTINILKGNYGCIDPASVVQYRGNVYFFDASNGRWVQYSANGLDNISAIKMTRFWKNWSYKYLSMTKDEIEALGNRPYVFATVDSAHDELLISIPKLSETPPKGYLPDYPSDVYPFDILDYQGKTIVYKLGTGAVVTPHWQGAYTFNTEYFAGVQNRLFTFKDGYVYENNQDNQNNFFGVQYDSKIMFTSNILPQVPKVYDNILLESNFIPNFVYFYNDYPNLQTSDLESVDFADVEGIWYASILRNKVVETNTGDVYTGLLTGEVMRNTNMYVLVRFSPTTSPLQLRLLQISSSISKGHTF